MRRRQAFTLIELLVVVAIIASLIAILLPSMNKARETAKQVLCATQARQIVAATMLYADSNKGILPLRKNDGTELPHRVKGAGYDLNKTFIEPYLFERNKIMFCPGRLIDARNPQTTIPANYGTDFVTYQYHVYQDDAGWRVPMPDLTRVSAFRRRYALWTCLTINASSVFYFGHDAPVVELPPSGFNSAFTDGSANWHDWEQRQGYWQNGTQYYVWPETYD